MSPEERAALLSHELMKQLARSLPFEALLFALVDTHPDRQVLFAAFERHAKGMDALADTIAPKAAEQMRPYFDKAYGEIVSAIRAGMVRERR